MSGHATKKFKVRVDIDACVKVTIVYDNTAFRKDLQSDWGFSALVEAEGIPTILFDTGGSGDILLDNMKRLHIDPAAIEEVFISHAHFDHIGGLSAFLSENDHVTVWTPPSFRGVKRASNVVSVPEPAELHDGVYSTGELEGIEQSLCVKTAEGTVVIVGCSHPRMEHILQTASQFGGASGIIGGLHGTQAASLQGLKLICATHCTQHKAEIKNRFPGEYVEGGAGQVVNV